MTKEIDNHYNPNAHVFASSAFTWAITTPERSISDLVKLMDKEGYPYNLYYVPLPHNSNYEINLFRPVVIGSTWLGTVTPGKKKAATRKKAVSC